MKWGYSFHSQARHPILRSILTGCWPPASLVADEYLRYSDIPGALALAQHHRLPTRLLDWTLNPIAAAFFAIEGLSDLLPERDIAVWALNRRHAKTVKTADVLFPNPPHGATSIDPFIEIVRPSIRDNPYLAAQSALFTTISGSGIYFMQHNGARPSIESSGILAAWSWISQRY